MTRKEIYAEVKKYNLEKTILKEYGDNVTRVPNVVLLDYIKNAKRKTSNKKAEQPVCALNSKNKQNDSESKGLANTDNQIQKIKKAFVTLVTHLSNYRVISAAKAEEILNF